VGRRVERRGQVDRLPDLLVGLVATDSEPARGEDDLGRRPGRGGLERHQRPGHRQAEVGVGVAQQLLDAPTGARVEDGAGDEIDFALCQQPTEQLLEHDTASYRLSL
jgi:hypothetical protein